MLIFQLIIVQPNNRVGPLGFFSTGTPDAPGNAGMWDVLLALKWTNDNIDSFGGDKNRVILMGTAAGAVSSDFLSITPMAQGLFRSAIFLSGTMFSPLVNVPQSENIRRYIAK